MFPTPTARKKLDCTSNARAPGSAVLSTANPWRGYADAVAAIFRLPNLSLQGERCAILGFLRICTWTNSTVAAHYTTLGTDGYIVHQQLVVCNFPGCTNRQVSYQVTPSHSVIHERCPQVTFCANRRHELRQSQVYLETSRETCRSVSRCFDDMHINASVTGRSVCVAQPMLKERIEVDALDR